MTVTTSGHPSHARLRVALAIAVLVFAAGTVAIVVHFHYPKSFDVVLKLDPGCSSGGLVRVGGHNWIGSGTTTKWPASVHGVFHVASPHRAVFTADGGGQESFVLLPKGQFWSMNCPLE